MPDTATQNDIDAYYVLCCNLLYQQRNAEGLCALAQTVSQSHPLLPSLPLLVGSYWSVLGQHERAILSMTEAVAQTPTRYTPWLLIGHEWS